MIAFIVFCFVLYMLVVLGITLPYWYEVGNTPSGDIPASSWSPRPVARLWLEAAWSAFLLGAAFPLDPLCRLAPPKGRADEDLPPVLLIHGLYHNPSGWVYLRRHLEKAGFRKIHTLRYSSRNMDIHAITGLLDHAVQDIESACPDKKPLLIGHSLGGLLIRNWLASEDNQRRILGAVTLGAPHRGSKMASLAFGSLGRSLLPTNPFFGELARRENPATVPCVSLVSEADTMVLPQQCLVPVTKGWDMRLTPYATHAGLLVKGPVLRMVVWELHRILNMAGEISKENPATGPDASDAVVEQSRGLPSPMALETTHTIPVSEIPEQETTPAKTPSRKASGANAKPGTPAKPKAAPKKTGKPATGAAAGDSKTPAAKPQRPKAPKAE